MKIQIDELAFEVELDGDEDAPVMMMHHSLATSHMMWEDLATALSQNFQVLRYDARGHGRTDAPQGPYNFEQLAGDAVGLMDALGLNKAHHVGISMGGMVAQVLGFMAPQRVETLTLVATSSKMAQKAGPIWDQRLAGVREKGMEHQVEQTIKRWFTKEFRDEQDPVIGEISELIRQTPINGYCGWGAAIRDLDITNRLGEIRAPTLIMVGAEDPGTPPANSQLIAQHINGAQLHIVPEVSHMLPLQKPDVFLETLIDFIEDQDDAELVA